MSDLSFHEFLDRMNPVKNPPTRAEIIGTGIVGALFAFGATLAVIIDRADDGPPPNIMPRYLFNATADGAVREGLPAQLRSSFDRCNPLIPISKDLSLRKAYDAQQVQEVLVCLEDNLGAALPDAAIRNEP